MPANHFSHFQFNVMPENLGFYRDLMTGLGWDPAVDNDGIVGFNDGTGDQSVWFFAQANDAENDYDGPGLNHIGLKADTVADVDNAVALLAATSVPPLFDTPRHRPDFVSEAGQTYYQVMFESPDRILFEVVYAGPHPV